MNLPIFSAVASLLISAITPVAAFAATSVVVCEAGKWEGHRTGFRGTDGENGINYPSVVIGFDDEAVFGDLASLQFGANYVSPEGHSTAGFVAFRAEDWYQKDYIIIFSQPQQIAETYTIDLETGDVVFTQTVGDGSGVNIDAFKRVCQIRSVEE